MARTQKYVFVTFLRKNSVFYYFNEHSKKTKNLFFLVLIYVRDISGAYKKMK